MPVNTAGGMTSAADSRGEKGERETAHRGKVSQLIAREVRWRDGHHNSTDSAAVGRTYGCITIE
jgi:hypothetical protein